MSVYGVPVQSIKAEEIPPVKEILEDQKDPNIQESIKQVTLNIKRINNNQNLFFDRSSQISFNPNMKQKISMRTTTNLSL